jgi:HEAT repeat protein
MARKNNNSLVLTLIVLVAVQCEGVVHANNRLMYENKPYSEWVLELSEWKKDPDKHPVVVNAVRQIGMAGLPHLLKCLSVEGVPSEGNEGAKNYDSTKLNRYRAVLAFEILGQRAREAAPPLLELAKNRGWRGRQNVLMSLAEVDPTNSVLFQLAAEDLKSTDTETRVSGLIIMRSNGSNQALDLIIEATNDPEQRVRDWAIHSLGSYLDQVRAKETLTQISIDNNRAPTDRLRAKLALNPNAINGFSLQPLPKRQ